MESNVQRSGLMALTREVILPFPYFGNIAFYARLIHNDAWVDLHEHYVKQSCRSRTEILSPNGVMKLSVPVLKSSGRKQTMAHIRVSYQEEWQKDHWRSLVTAYNSSPYFLYYRDAIESFFRESFITLAELNKAAHHLVCELLKLDLPIRYTEHYIASSYGEDYKDDPSCDLSSFPPYIQVFSDRHAFMPNLSILDLIFCNGPESKDYLEKLLY